MEGRITVEELVAWLGHYDPKSEIGFLVEGKARTMPHQMSDFAYVLKEITERGRCRRPVSGESPPTTLFFNIE